MPTFEQLLNARLGPMDAAATQWTEMIAKLTALRTDAAAMKSKADTSTWRGENATVTKAFVGKTAKEFGDAVAEAESVRDLLKDAHTLLKTAQDDLKAAYENPPPGITIYPNGVLSHRIHPDRRPAGSTEPVATQAQFDALRGKLEGILQRAAEADELCAWGLRALVRNHPNDFAEKGPRDIGEARRQREDEQRQAANGREAAGLYARWDHLDDKERARLLELVEGGKDVPAFTTELMTNLGYFGREDQEALLLLAGSLEHGGRDGQVSATDARLYKALSASLATATGPDSPLGTPGGVPADWTQRLLATARNGNGLPDRHPGALPGGATGWNELTGLMAADAGDAPYDPKDPKDSQFRKDKDDPVYSEAFLTQVGNGIREWETGRKNAYDGVMEHWQGTQQDPMKGLLNAMSRNPDAATHYFDPNTTDNLKYFLEDRKWPGADVQDKMPEDTQRSSARAEFAAAVDAAATGRPPGTDMSPVGTRHDGAQSAIFERMLAEYAEDTRKNPSAVPVSLRMAMGEMIGSYGSDVNEILGKNMDNPTAFNDLTVSRGDLIRIIRSVSEDPQAFGAIHASQTAVVAEGLDRFPVESYRTEDPVMRSWVAQSSSVLGTLDGVRGDVIFDLGQAKKDANAWNKMMNYHVIGAPFTGIPWAGDVIQRSIDVSTADYMNGLNAKVDAETRNNMINHYDNGQRQMLTMLRETARERDLDPKLFDDGTQEFERGLQRTAQEWYQMGIKAADLHMGERY
ncbi:DUF6571 family protein [Streptomyces sp. NPDC048659]|uniref:DUF6571 family protein n=1 Tax=Streptomyces sp. NPDC048659 TaxID=3155489 RepID=UPI0034287442